jgi:hypothetical protein
LRRGRAPPTPKTPPDGVVALRRTTPYPLQGGEWEKMGAFSDGLGRQNAAPTVP